MAGSTDRKIPKTRRRRRTRGALATIGLLLMASAVLRIATGAGEAFAREGEGDAAAQVAPMAGAAPEGSGTPPPRIIAEADILPIIEALDQREARVRAREEALAMRLQALSVAETEIEERMQALAQAESQLRDTLALAQTAAEDDLAQLTDVYATMKPKQAAALFEEMDPRFAAGFLGRMPANAAADIMAGLTPETAYTISVVLAGRNADVPDE
ncbi:MotE family protein [Pseudoponticoccus marisrubri]|uniref:Magnesium transporter MgtE intracellular domain-containing protein n=1 Tax=Pseudoponticoccus marisrubri TaxID=1685382 RepID=A0A0W7WJ00_9RHOB|nr:hypothetical protein [Pseudoponticoccus marisrubri]KUF10557.1 hypothetical protein AVJ23_11810 [Pseudoponticoccus marisrubri]